MSTPPVPLRRLRRHASACASALVVLGAGTAATSAASAATLPPGAPQRGDVQDVRASLRAPGVRGPPRPARAERAARRGLVRRLGPQARLEVDPLTDTVRVLQRLDGALTGPAAASPQTVARRYARDHAAALGLDATDVDDLVAAPTVRTPSGITIVRFRQAAAGIPAFDNELRLAVDRGNRVVTVAGAPRHDLAV